MLINITGNSGCGKSTLSKILAKNLNAEIIDVDLIVVNMYNDEHMQQTIKNTFGDIVVGESGRVEKKLVSKLVFSDVKSMQDLDKITRTYIEGKIDQAIVSSGNNAIIDHKFLPITKYYEMATYNILIVPKEETQRIENLIKRDNITIEQIQKRDSNSPNYMKYSFDFVIKNDYTQNFVRECENVTQKIKENTK